MVLTSQVINTLILRDARGERVATVEVFADAAASGGTITLTGFFPVEVAKTRLIRKVELINADVYSAIAEERILHWGRWIVHVTLAMGVPDFTVQFQREDGGLRR